MCGGGAIAPKLRTHVADNLRGEAAVAKDSRKAREESAAQGRPRGSGGGLQRQRRGRGGRGGGEAGAGAVDPNA